MQQRLPDRQTPVPGNTTAYQKVNRLMLPWLWVITLFIVPLANVGAQTAELRVGVMLAPKQRSPYEAIFSRFTEESGIRVRSINLPNAQYKSTLPQWLLEGKNTPDVVFWNASQRLVYYAERQALVPITELWMQDRLDAHFSHVKSAVSWKDDVYGLPISYYHWGLYYRKSLIDKYGGVPASWSGFLTLCEKLQESGITPIGLGAKNHWPAAAWFDYLNLRLHGLPFHQSLLTGKVSFHDARVQKVLIEWKRLIDPAYFNSDSAALDWHEVLPFLYHKKVAFTLMGNFVATALPPDVAPDIGFMPFPTMKNSVGPFEEAPLDVLMVPRRAQHPAHALKFIQFMARADIQSRLNESLGFLPPNKSSSVGNDALIRSGADLLRNAKGVAQYFDRDTVPAFEAKAVPLLAAFVRNGNAKELSDKLEQARQEVFGTP
ncbi:MAG: carbohydrate ABC transporter substrate-binding protein [Burkholderiales bacterium]|nr:carbohydrate ABC transporter substrate-binding protein [Burkholderiales bacterium]